MYVNTQYTVRTVYLRNNSRPLDSLVDSCSVPYRYMHMLDSTHTRERYEEVTADWLI